MRRDVTEFISFSVLFFFIFFFTSSNIYAASISWDGGGNATSWNDETNWSGNVLPANGDDVTIDANVTVNLDTSPPNRAYGGTPTASGSFVAATIFNGNLADSTSSNATGAQWVKYDLGASVTRTVVKYSVRCGTSASTDSPKSWTLQGSNNDSTWTDLDTRTAQTGWSNNEARTFTFSNSTAYRYYRLNAINPQTIYNYTRLSEIELYDSSGTFTIPTLNSITLGNGSGTTTPTLNLNYDAITSGALTISGGNFVINQNATLTHTGNSSTAAYTAYVNVTAGDMTIASGGSVNVSQKGYKGGAGTGGGGENTSVAANAGASHGGVGGSSYTRTPAAVYGSITQPVTLGSGGGQYTDGYDGGKGGGAIKLTVSGALTVAGTINANGGNYQTTSLEPAGGSGGSVNITAGALAGAGAITANGGNGYSSGGGGGGGRIAIYYTTKTHNGTISAFGGTGYSYAGAGTVYLKPSAQTYGDLIIDNNNQLQSSGSEWIMGKTTIGTTETFNAITLRNYGNLETTSSTNITYSSLDWSTKGIVTDNGGTFALVSGGGSLTIPATAYLFANTARTFTGLSVSGVLTHTNNRTSVARTLDYTVNGNMTIETGGTVDVASKGYKNGYGTGGGGESNSSSNNGGAGHGGSGASSKLRNGGSAYGSISQPATLGSGGGQYNDTYPGGKGGGLAKLTVSGVLTVTGTINANGGNYLTTTFDPGGGAGGGIYIIAGTFAGSGAITANGGNGYSSGGGGGGGRIAIYYTTKTHNGTISAYGGTGWAAGGAGTVFLKANSQSYGDLIIDNNNQLSVWDLYMGKTTVSTTEAYDSITLRNYGNLDVATSASITYSSLDWSTKGIVTDNGGTFALVSGGGSLTIPATAYLFANTARTFTGLDVMGTLTHSANSTTEAYKIQLSVSGNATITGSIDATGKGFKWSEGTGQGGDGTNPGGAAHGGIGGNGSSRAGSLVTYGSATQPTNLGSGGGGYNSDNYGGSGGGAIKLTVGGDLSVGGQINANGNNGPALWGAGGSGGSIYLIVGGTMSGSSNINAKGGNGNSNSNDGGGGGGRIAIYYSNKTYSGALSVSGGTGYQAGQQGTTVIKATYGELVSSPYDSGDLATVLNKISWTENLTSGTDVKFQLRTAPDNEGVVGTWGPWLGPSGEDTYYTDPVGNDTINAGHSDATDDQWFQYKAILTSNEGDTNIPTLSDVALEYVVNTPPTITMTNTPSGSTSGVFTVTYDLSDPEETNHNVYVAVNLGTTLSENLAKLDTSSIEISDTSYLPTSGTVMIDNEMISYTAKDADSIMGTITRGANTTRAAAHSTGVTVWYVASLATGDEGAVTVGTGKNLQWAPANEVGDIETETAVLKIIANDGNGANQIGTDSSGPTVFDTKSPTLTDIFIDSRLDKLTLQATDANTKYMKISNRNDMAYDGTNPNSGNWLTFASTYDWTMPTGTETVYVQYKDIFGNETSSVDTTAPEEPSSVLIQDASNPDTEEWRLFVSWAVSSEPVEGFDYYQIYRSTDNITFTPLVQINTITQNFYLDESLQNVSTYYYKVTVIDDHGNESSYNTVNQTATTASRSGLGLIPDGSAGGDFEAPVITNLAVSNITTDGATFTWNTDELADSKIGYSTNTSYTDEVGIVTMLTNHSVVVSNLTPNTKYYYRAISYDAVSNKGTEEDSSTYFFTTLEDTGAPIISQVKSVVGETSAGITWSTNEEADSTVEYSIDDSLNIASASADMVLGHSVAIPGLTKNTTYNYRVKSKDSSGNEATSPTYTFKTLTGVDLDLTPPSISNISVSEITSSGAKVSWETNEDADGKVEYGETVTYERGVAEGNHVYTKSKSVQLVGLYPGTTYHYRVIAVDEAGNLNNSSDATFATTEPPAIESISEAGQSVGANAPTITSNGPSTADITSDSVVLSWATSKKSTSQVFFKAKGADGGYINGGDATVFVTDHEVKLSNLTPATTYEYQVKSTDVNGNYIVSSVYSFTTTLPDVVAVRVVSLSESEATVEWKTGIPTNTLIEYTNTQTQEKGIFKDSSLVTTHKATLKDLMGSTTYTFTIVITDEAGKTARSSQYSFNTEKDSVGPEIRVVNSRSTIMSGQNKVQTIITWSTDEPSSSQAEYSTDMTATNFDIKSLKTADFVTEHIVVLPNLKPATAYRYQVLSTDRSGNETKSEPYVLLTPQREITALDLIITNLESIFGWTKNINQ